MKSIAIPTNTPPKDARKKRKKTGSESKEKRGENEKKKEKERGRESFTHWYNPQITATPRVEPGLCQEPPTTFRSLA